jgi:hypothetical protein
MPYNMIAGSKEKDTPGTFSEKDTKTLTEKQKYQVAATAIGEDPSFGLKTFGDTPNTVDPLFSRSYIQTKKELKKKKPKVYADLYGKK